ncbi:MAG: hypothetical protein QME41_07875 [Actinomycetota bacterium]|nr:hypothetical protein [Actinomycetota bacterium]
MKIRTKMLNTTKKEVTQMKKGLVILMAISMLFAMGSMALAAGNIYPNSYNLTGAVNGNPAKNYQYYEQGKATSSGSYSGSTPTGVYLNSTHVYGTWNSPYTSGIDGYNYNDAQDYTNDGAQAAQGGSHTITLPVNGMMENELFGMFMTAMGAADMGELMAGLAAAGVTVTGGPGSYAMNVTAAGNFTSGPHGGYLTSTHRCRECHAVHRAAGKFKLLRSDTRFEACDWCHGTGAGSGYNIQMDNNDNYTTEYNVGHTMGFGIDTGKWKAPDDTYPAFTPNYWQGGFSCFDCHSPHANPARMLGYDAAGKAIESIVDLWTGQTYNLGNPGHDMYTSGGEGFAQTKADFSKVAWVPALGGPLPMKSKPYYLAGSWLLIKNPDREIAANAYSNVPVDIYSVPSMMPNGTAPFGGPVTKDATITAIAAGTEIPDNVTMDLNEYSATTGFPVNKTPIDWNNPIGSASILEDTQMFGFAPQGPGAPGPVNPFVPVDSNGAPVDLDGDDYGNTLRNPFCKSLIVDEFCTDCHDGNAGLHTQQAPLFSEDRALRSSLVSTGTTDTANFKTFYDLAYGHDTSVRH